jgi:hypothetical protein
VTRKVFLPHGHVTALSMEVRTSILVTRLHAACELLALVPSEVRCSCPLHVRAKYWQLRVTWIKENCTLSSPTPNSTRSRPLFLFVKLFFIYLSFFFFFFLFPWGNNSCRQFMSSPWLSQRREAQAALLIRVINSVHYRLPEQGTERTCEQKDTTRRCRRVYNNCITGVCLVRIGSRKSLHPNDAFSSALAIQT